jgi:hypothetical protein
VGVLDEGLLSRFVERDLIAESLFYLEVFLDDEGKHDYSRYHCSRLPYVC